MKIEKFIKIDKIEELDFEGLVYSLKIKNDPSYCLATKIVTKNCDLPDIDMDFEDVRRDEVRKYLSDKYGEFNVVGLSNFLTMKGKGVLRDVSRVFDVPLAEVDFAAKAMVEADEGQEISKSFAEVQECWRFAKKYPEVVEIAQSIEGQIRGCLSGDCRLLLPNGDGRIKVKKIWKLYKDKYRGKVRSYDLTRKVLFFDDIVDIWQTGIKKVYDLKTTYGGRTIRLTADHKLLTRNGWKEASKIQIGEFVATNGIPWNKGLKGYQDAWNKGLTKGEHPGVMVHSKRMRKNNPAKLDYVKKQVSQRSFKHGKFSIPPKYKTEHPICEVCGLAETKEVHHIDLDSYNNDESNLLATCIDCHHKIHWSLSDQDLHKINPLKTIGWSRVISFQYVGEEMTYDIEMKSPNQNFVCNKIITHNCGQHAAAVCISQVDLRQGHNCNLVARAGTLVANWDMRNAEYCGLMKLDILGLSALTILNECRRMIKENHDIDIDYKKLTFDDPKVFAEISAGNTVGAFQIGSNGLTKYCQELGVENFAMLYAVTALWRPGPMQSGMTESYSKRKRGKEKVEKIHPIFDALTKETFGLIVYQEQVMKVVNQLAGISMATCNKIRKIIGKSMGNAAFDKYKEEFLQGCKNQGTVPEKKAIQIWDMMSKFGGYGFNMCLSENTMVRLEGGNQHVKSDMSISDLYKMYESNPTKSVRNQGKKPVLVSFDGEKGIPQKSVRIIKNGKKLCYRYSFDDGSFVECTRSHKFLIDGEWQRIKKAVIGSIFSSLELPKYKQELKNTSTKGKKYPKSHKGFLEGKENPSFKNGKTKALNEYKELMFNTPCEVCGNSHERMEVHHKDFEGGEKYPYWLTWLCPGCHKKEHYSKGRKKRWSKGRVLTSKTLVMIEEIGLVETYDIEMPVYHNFMLSNGLITHNSHSVEYSMITYWDMWAKTYYPNEFLASCLTLGDKTKNVDYIREARRLGLKINLPKIGVSHAIKWNCDKKGNLFAPFISINGVGEAVAEKIAAAKINNKVRKGFFTSDSSEKIPGVNKNVTAILTAIKAFDQDYQTTKEDLKKHKNLFIF